MKGQGRPFKGKCHSATTNVTRWRNTSGSSHITNPSYRGIKKKKICNQWIIMTTLTKVIQSNYKFFSLRQSSIHLKAALLLAKMLVPALLWFAILNVYSRVVFIKSCSMFEVLHYDVLVKWPRCPRRLCNVSETFLWGPFSHVVCMASHLPTRVGPQDQAGT